MQNKELSLQEQFAPHNRCFGCGPENDQGLKIKSYPQGDKVIAVWKAMPHHEAFPGILNGGIIGALLDCHSNWTAAYFLMKEANEETPPCTVTAYFNVKLLRPTPSDKEVELIASVKSMEADRAIIQASLLSEGKRSATCEGLFVAVKPGHPAYQRW